MVGMLGDVVGKVLWGVTGNIILFNMEDVSMQ